MPSKRQLARGEPVEWTCRIYSEIDLAIFFDFSRGAFSVALEPAEVAELLRKAGAREPWQHRPIAIGRIDHFVPTGMSHAHREVRAALRKLRRFLPDLIDEFEQQRQDMNNPVRFGQLALRRGLVTTAHNEKLEEFLELKSALDSIIEELPLGKGPTASWHPNAISVLNAYRQIVGPKSGLWADGPAVKFIEIILKRLTGEAPERAAIEAAIRTWPYWGEPPWSR